MGRKESKQTNKQPELDVTFSVANACEEYCYVLRTISFADLRIIIAFYVGVSNVHQTLKCNFLSFYVVVTFLSRISVYIFVIIS